ncbi:MAG: hypothetical protein H6605_02865 [Flavobacteriales bacterium]|nr:hypothetical protein [Flavobacteriales bacterium]
MKRYDTLFAAIRKLQCSDFKMKLSTLFLLTLFLIVQLANAGTFVSGKTNKYFSDTKATRSYSASFHTIKDSQDSPYRFLWFESETSLFEESDNSEEQSGGSSWECNVDLLPFYLHCKKTKSSLFKIQSSEYNRKSIPLYILHTSWKSDLS